MAYSTSKICDQIHTLEWIPVHLLRKLADISLLRQFNDNILKIRDAIQLTFSGSKTITSETTRFPDDGAYCFSNHPSLRDNLAELLVVAQDNDLRYIDSSALRGRLVKSLNELSKVVYSLSESTRALHGIFNRETFESTFQLTWNSEVEHQSGENGCTCKDCSECSDCKQQCRCTMLVEGNTDGCNDDGSKCKAE